MTRAAQWGDGRLPERFWKFVSPGRSPNDCWRWTGALRRGYATFWLDGRNTGAHVLAYTKLTGPIPDGLQLDHVCHDKSTCRLAEACPHRACVNPAHLQIATARSNTLRSSAPSARFAVATHCVNGHEFTEQNTYWRPTGGRACKQCAFDRNRRYKPLAVRRLDYDTHCVNGHPWDGNIRADPSGWRQCKACARERARRRRQRAS